MSYINYSKNKNSLKSLATHRATKNTLPTHRPKKRNSLPTHRPKKQLKMNKDKVKS